MDTISRLPDTAADAKQEAKKPRKTKGTTEMKEPIQSKQIKELPPKEEKKTAKKFFAANRRHLVLCCTLLLVAAALVLNVVLFGGNDPTPSLPTGDEQGGDSGAVDNTLDSYFSATQVSRQRARDEALEVLQSVVDNASADEATKTGALQEIAELAADMEAEANIESLVLSRGFAQCVAIINDGICSVVVNGSTLQPGQISQINEIVYEQSGILPANIRIITK